MKKLLIFMLYTMFLCFSAAAQQKVEKSRKNHEKPDKEKIIEKKCKQVAERLMLDDAATEKFLSVYKDYLNELSGNIELKKFQDDKVTNDSDIDKNMRDEFAKTRKTVDIREKYYNEFRTFLTAKQAKTAIKMHDRKNHYKKRFAKSDNLFKKQLDFSHDKQRLNKANPSQQ